MLALASDTLQRIQSLLTYDPAAPLIFSSGLFLFLFAAFLLVYHGLRNTTLPRLIYVILFSLYFYYKSSGLYFLLLLFAATSDFWIARRLSAT